MSSRVLVVDDDPALARLFAVILHAEGMDVLNASDGYEALTQFQARQEKIDLVLLDLAMPGMDGREAFRQLRSAGFTGPVIICSAFGAVQANRELGAQGAIEKPFDPDALLYAIQQALPSNGSSNGENHRSVG